MKQPLDLEYPFTGSWEARNSPADRVPSHGTTAFATSYAIDFVPVTETGRSAPITLGTLIRPEPADRFPGFGRPILAPIAGTVVATHDADPDHAAYRGLPSIGYALSQGRRAAAGWRALTGNHVLIQTSGGPVVVLCHLQLGSVEVAVGQEVAIGDVVGRCGNSGNSTEPHLHLQAISGQDLSEATAVRFTLPGGLPRNGEVVRVGGRVH